MKDLRDLKDWTIHDVKPISVEQTTGRRHSLDRGEKVCSTFSNSLVVAWILIDQDLEC